MSKRLVAIGNRSGVTAALIELAEAHEMKMAEAASERLAALVRTAFIAGPLADLEQQNRHANEQAETDDLDATYDAACGRWGY